MFRKAALGNVAALASGVVLLDGTESDGVQILAGNAAMTTGWTVSDTSLVNGTALAPNGLTDASDLRVNTNNVRHIAYQNPTIAANINLTFSVYAKQAQYRYFQFLIAGNSAPSKFYLYYDLQTGTVTDSGIISPGTGSVINSTSCLPAVNGFYKCSVNFKYDSTATQIFTQINMSDVSTYAAPLDLDSPRFAGANTTDKILLWRPNLA